MLGIGGGLGKGVCVVKGDAVRGYVKLGSRVCVGRGV